MKTPTDPEQDPRSAPGAAQDGGDPGLGARRFRSVLLGWTDPETGDRLSVRMDGSRSLVSRLERDGFEVLTTEEPGSLPGSLPGPARGTHPGLDGQDPGVARASERTLSITARLLSVSRRLGRRNTA